MIGGGTGGRALFIGRARVELHHLPCISLFFSQPGEVDSLRRAESFLGDYGNAKGYKIIISDEVSSLQLCGHRLLCCARIFQ